MMGMKKRMKRGGKAMKKKIKKAMGGGVMKKRMKAGGKALKKVDTAKNPGLAKLPTKVRKKMGFMKRGGTAKKKMMGGGMMKKRMKRGGKAK